MWSKKPTPVSRVPAPVPDRPSVRATSVSPVLRLSWRCGSRRFDAARAILTQACHARRRAAGEAFGLGDRHAGGGQRGRGVVQADLGHPAPEVAHVEAGGEARGALGRAACGSNPRRSRRTRSRPRCRRTGSRRSGRAARAPRPPRPRAAGARARAPRRTPARPPCRRRARGCGASSAVEDRLVVADRDGQRALAVLGLGLQVELERLDVGALGGDHRQVATARRTRRCRRRRETCRLASCTHRLPGPTITSTRGIDSVP